MERNIVASACKTGWLNLNKSGVSWTDYSWGPWRGCTKVTLECRNCYAEREMKRFGHDFKTVVRAADSTFRKPLVMNKLHTSENPGKVFVCPWSDFFHADADEWRQEAWDIIRECRNLIFIIPTKRYERCGHFLPDDWYDGYDNVCILWSCGYNETFQRAWNHLSSVRAKYFGLSIEPLIGSMPAVIWAINGLVMFDWVIVGGESGPNARPMQTQWARDIRDACKSAGVPFYFKQHSGPRPGMEPLLDGVDHREFPKLLLTQSDGLLN